MILGFGNGAIVVLSTRNDYNVREIESTIKKIDLEFTGPENKAIDKMKIIYIENPG